MVNIGIKLYDNTIHQIGDIASVQGVETTITTIVDYQKKAEIEVLVSDPSYSDKYFSIGTLLIQNLPQAKAGEPRISLKFYLDEEYTLNIFIMSKDILRKQVKITKDRWEPSLEKYEQEDKVGKTAPGPLFTIDLSLTDTYKTGESTPLKEEEEEETARDTKGRDIIIPILIIASLIIVVFFAVYFFFVLRPWDMAKRGEPGPTQPVPTREITRDEDIIPESTEIERVIDTETSEPEDKESIKVDETDTVRIDLDKINNELKSIGPIYFTPNSSRIKNPAELKKCDRIAVSIKEYKNDILLILSGHTAKAGSAGEQQELSVERADAVRKELIARGAITKEACRIQGFGSENPVTLDSKKGYLNRRVDLRVEFLE